MVCIAACGLGMSIVYTAGFGGGCTYKTEVGIFATPAGILSCLLKIGTGVSAALDCTATVSELRGATILNALPGNMKAAIRESILCKRLLINVLI